MAAAAGDSDTRYRLYEMLKLDGEVAYAMVLIRRQ
jgi:hypothetical protein